MASGAGTLARRFHGGRIGAVPSPSLPFACVISSLIFVSVTTFAQARSPGPVLDRDHGQPESASALSQRAERNIAAAEAAFRRSLLASLASSNPFERRLALERFAQVPTLVDGAVVAALVPHLAESLAVAPAWCSSAMESRGGGPDDQDRGAEIAYAVCERSTIKSEGQLAAELLTGRDAFPTIVAFVADRPSSVEVVIHSLGPSRQGPASTVVATLGSTRSFEAQMALLRMAVTSTCDRASSPIKVDPVAALASSARKELARMASVALVRLTKCSPTPAQAHAEESRQRAISTLDASLGDLSDETIVKQISVLGPDAKPFLPALLARFDRVIDDRDRASAVLGVIGAVGPGASSATPVLVRVLQNRKRAFLWRAAVRAIGDIGASAGTAKGAVLEVEPFPVSHLSEVTDALAKIQAHLDHGEFDRLDARYRRECGPARPSEANGTGADPCRTVTRALGELARSGGYAFRPIPGGP